ncbi:hypothetical protein GCM10010207_12370 [Streptomyces atratus]|nr:hypothetical protein GCM10010207_12370 [Streptomyces atratus]
MRRGEVQRVDRAEPVAGGQLPCAVEEERWHPYERTLVEPFLGFGGDICARTDGRAVRARPPYA